MNHSRSPWIAANASGGRIYKRWGVFSGDGVRIATMQEMSSSEKEHSNAVLMAAALELIKALNEALCVLDVQNAETRQNSRYKHLWDVFAKATGEQINV